MMMTSTDRGEEGGGETRREIDERTKLLQDQVSLEIKKTARDPKEDLRKERLRATFDANELEKLLAGGKKNLLLRKTIAEVLTNDKVFKNKREKYSWTREELYLRTLEKYLEIPRVAREVLIRTTRTNGEKNHNHQEMTKKQSTQDVIAIARIVREFIDEPGGLDLHLGMFIPTIQGQGTEQQKKYWIPKCVNLEIVGTYAQTELGHGTFIRGLETTCTYDKNTKEFIVHSPTLTATKWWPGGLGKTSTHAIVMARLFVPNLLFSSSLGDEKFVDKGIHAFVVQIRSTKNHMPLSGIQCGDIGDKMGYNAVDNGFLRFDHVRIPKDSMLMGHSKVLDDGTYVEPPVKKAAYGTMVFVRSDIVMNAALYMKKAVTIALRYNLVRRQSNADAKNGNLETQVLDYQHSQRTLFPILASAFAFHCTSDFMRRMYFEFLKRSQSEQKDFEALPELHATSSGLKAFCSWKTKDAIESCRLTCGGHGYIGNAGFGTTFASYAPNVTYEGDNNVLCLQTSRYLLKTMRALQEKLVVTSVKLVGQMRYLSEGGNSFTSRLGHEVGIRDEDSLMRAYEHRAWRLCSQATARAGTISVDEAMRTDMVSWIRVAKAHCALVVLSNFFDGIKEAKKLQVSKETILVLQRLATLHALCGMEDELGDWLEDGYFDSSQCQLIRNEIAILLQELRPDAAALSDSLGLDDYFLNSTLGSKDGDVYERLYEAAQNAPFNKSHKPPGYDDLLWPRFNKQKKDIASSGFNASGRSKL